MIRNRLSEGHRHFRDKEKKRWLKVYAAELCDLCVVGLVAAGTFSPRIGWELRDALPQLKHVRIAYDADKRTNHVVARQLKRLKRALARAGIDQSEWTWQAELGNGLDDYLISSASL